MAWGHSETRGQIPAVPQSLSVTSGKSLSISVPQFLSVKWGYKGGGGNRQQCKLELLLSLHRARQHEIREPTTDSSWLAIVPVSGACMD